MNANPECLSSLYVRQTPAEFLRQAAALLEGIQGRYRDDEWKPLREAWVLGQVGLAAKATSVRLGGDPPDGELYIPEGEMVPVEIVECLKPGRKPHEEARAGTIDEPLHISRWDEEVGSISNALAVQLAKKKSKGYDPQTLLVVYLNLGHDFRPPPRPILDLIRNVQSESGAPFSGVCVLWRGQVFGPDHLIESGEFRFNADVMTM